jgi:hypothetical protein
MESFRDRLSFWMGERGIKAKPLSLKAGLHETYVRDIMQRTQTPGLDKVAMLAEALDIYPHDLVPEIRQCYPPEALALLDELSEIREKKRHVSSKLGQLK